MKECPATQEMLLQWVDESPPHATHMLVVTDEYDWTDYPVYVMPGEIAQLVFVEVSKKPMQRVQEVYDLRPDGFSIELQLKQYISWAI